MISMNIMYLPYIKLYSLLIDAWQQSMWDFVAMMIVLAFCGISIIIVGYVVHSFVHELGHLISGILCGAKLIVIKVPFVLVKKSRAGYNIHLHNSMFRNECIVTEFKCNKMKQSALFISLGGICAQIILTIVTVIIAYSSQTIWSIINLILAILGIAIIVMNLNIFSRKWVCDGIIAKEILFEKDGAWNYNYYAKLQRLLLHQNYSEIDIDDIDHINDKKINYNGLECTKKKQKEMKCNEIKEKEIKCKKLKNIVIKNNSLQHGTNVDGWNYVSNITHYIILIYIRVYISKNQYNKAYELLSRVLSNEVSILEEKRLEFEIERWYICLLYWNENINIMGKDIVAVLKELKVSKNEFYYILCNLAYEQIICKKSGLALDLESILNSLNKKGLLDCDYGYIKDEIHKIIRRAEGVNENGCIG